MNPPAAAARVPVAIVSLCSSPARAGACADRRGRGRAPGPRTRAPRRRAARDPARPPRCDSSTTSTSASASRPVDGSITLAPRNSTASGTGHLALGLASAAGLAPPPSNRYSSDMRTAMPFVTCSSITEPGRSVDVGVDLHTSVHRSRVHDQRALGQHRGAGRRSGRTAGCTRARSGSTRDAGVPAARGACSRRRASGSLHRCRSSPARPTKERRVGSAWAVRSA